MPASKPGMWGASTFRRLSLIGHKRGIAGPHDIRVSDGVSARLYPRSNRCEKRAYAGVQTWDAMERAALDDALSTGTKKPFVFFDVGANVGLYSLFLNETANRLGRKLHIVAVEPDPENRARLEFNATASGTRMTIEPVAISGESGHGILAGGENNRGAVGLADPSDTTVIDGVDVTLETLASVVARQKLPQIDAMKVDIEGYDLVALAAFFQQASEHLFPRLLIVEIGKTENSPIVELALKNGYNLAQRTGINAILCRSDI